MLLIFDSAKPFGFSASEDYFWLRKEILQCCSLLSESIKFVVDFVTGFVKKVFKVILHERRGRDEFTTEQRFWKD